MGKLHNRWLAAKAKGLKIFDVGIPCKHGHLSGRHVGASEYSCIECRKLRQQRPENKKAQVHASMKWQKNNPERFREIQNRYYARKKALKSQPRELE